MKYELRLQIVQCALERGVKPAAREFGCDRKTVRLWTRRFQEANGARSALADRSRAPHTCPHKASAKVEARVIACRKKAPCMGPRRLKRDFGVKLGHNAIGRILRQAGLTQKRKKKYQKKRDMREVKAKLAALQEIQVDTKYLTDIPFYVEQLARKADLPRFEYTARDVRTGAVFLGFANELSESHACAFVDAIDDHLRTLGLALRGRATIQTDNGSEFSGAEHTRARHGFAWRVENTLGARHRFIPPGLKNRQADVETLHHHIEREFFDLETFSDRKDFLNKASYWQLWWNVARPNGYKGDKTPDEIFRQAEPRRDPKIWLTPVFDLDQALARKIQRAIRGSPGPAGGEDVPGLPAPLMAATRFRGIDGNPGAAAGGPAGSTK